MKVCFETFGCRLNRAEALEIEAAFLARGWTRTERHDDADMIIVRGCSVTARAQADCERLIAHIRNKYPFKRVVVTGCIKNHSNERWLKDLVTGQGPAPTRTARAYLKIQDGCSAQCSFCIVPTFRGKAKSVPLEEAVAGAKRFLDAGYHEIVLTGCSLSQYADGGHRLADVLAAIADIPGYSHRVRLGSVEPVAAAMDVVEAMAERENVCRFLHLPVQSGSGRMLTAMRRPYSVKDVDTLVKKAVSAMPEISIGCDMMSGFPGESDMDHLATMAMIKRLPFSNAHVFPYSERPGTPAASLDDSVPPSLRSERAHDIADAVAKKRADFAGHFRGRVVKIVVEDSGTLAGWTSEYLWCRLSRAFAEARVNSLSGRTTFPRKSIVAMRVTEVKGYSLRGVPV
ncbi:MAG: radical SAM protein [Kiritimatiellae bacterium]|nr:radical SAM protein [Kiritimatiellia bacterium]